MRADYTTDVAVVGGGLAGLAAATYLARAGRRVVVFEQARAVGGRARSRANQGFLFNLGPHALYRGGPAEAVLRELGVSYRGAVPAFRAYGLRAGRLERLPTEPLGFLATGLFSPREKLALAGWLARLWRLDPTALDAVPARAWLEDGVSEPGLRPLLAMLLRLTTFSNDPDRLSAGAALAQLRQALQRGVLYLDGGWQRLVDGLRHAAEAAGVRLVTGARVSAVVHDDAVRGVRLADGWVWAADAVVLALGPGAAAALVDWAAAARLRQWAAAAVPVRAATLDVALGSLPNPRAPLVYGLDAPVYLSVHSAWARLAPPGGALVHVMRYLGPEPPADPRAVERELEALLDLAQPGWRAALVARRFVPNLVVAHALPLAAQGGTRGRPGPAVPELPGLYVAGDWVGPEGLLADASLASARRAAQQILAAPARRPAALPASA